MSSFRPPARDRIASAVAAAAVQIAFGYLLITALGVSLPAPARDELKVFGIAPKPPPPPEEKIVPKHDPSKKKSGKASPVNLKAQRTEVVAPPPVVVLPPPPPPVVSAPIAGLGNAAFAGATKVRGPGSGAGGQGNGTGSGGSGNGEGDGEETPPRKIKGRLKFSDLPRELTEIGRSYTVGLRYRVEVNGRATHCSVTQSSGNAMLDTATCALIEKHFRFKPSRDEDGEPVPSTIIENETWVVDDPPAPDPAGSKR